VSNQWRKDLESFVGDLKENVKELEQQGQQRKLSSDKPSDPSPEVKQELDAQMNDQKGDTQTQLRVNDVTRTEVQSSRYGHQIAQHGHYQHPQYQAVPPYQQNQPNENQGYGQTQAQAQVQTQVQSAPQISSPFPPPYHFRQPQQPPRYQEFPPPRPLYSVSASQGLAHYQHAYARGSAPQHMQPRMTQSQPLPRPHQEQQQSARYWQLYSGGMPPSGDRLDGANMTSGCNVALAPNAPNAANIANSQASGTSASALYPKLRKQV